MLQNLRKSFSRDIFRRWKKTIIHDVTGAGLHKELSTGNKFLLMHEVDSNLTKLGFYQAGKVRFFPFNMYLLAFRTKYLYFSYVKRMNKSMKEFTCMFVLVLLQVVLHAVFDCASNGDIFRY